MRNVAAKNDSPTASSSPSSSGGDGKTNSNTSPTGSPRKIWIVAALLVVIVELLYIGNLISSNGCFLGGSASSTTRTKNGGMSVFPDDSGQSLSMSSTSSSSRSDKTTTSKSNKDKDSLSVQDRARQDSERFRLEPQQRMDRTWRQWDYSQHPFPCFPCEKDWRDYTVMRTPSKRGLLMIRNMKTGSSTLGGVAIRIARAMKRKTKPQLPAEMCKVRWDHTPAFQLKFGERIYDESFLFSFVREPTKRAMSEFFHFGVSRFKLEPSYENFKQYFRERVFLSNYFLWDMSLNGFNNEVKNKTKVVQEIMEGYDFIGVTERMDESLVVLKMLLGLDLNDVLYLAASKGNGGFDDGAYQGKCHYIVPKYTSPGVEKWLASDEWKARVDGDEQLFKAANRSLELTIEKLGRENVYRELEEFQQLKQLAMDKCAETTIFPCTADGNLHVRNHSCLWWDLGCGYQCLDSLRDDYDPVAEATPPPVQQVNFAAMKAKLEKKLEKKQKAEGGDDHEDDK